MSLSADAPVARGAPGSDSGVVAGKAERENFVVASRLLPRRWRDDLLTIYSYARFVDDLGDLAPGDRALELDFAERELDKALAGTATHPVFAHVGMLARSLRLGREPFADLIEANRRDQVVQRYETYGDLAGYCALSANPVGRLVLRVFGTDGEEAVACSDRICTALQLVEHLQDVAEDHAVGRVYLPVEDLERFGVDETMLEGPARPSGVSPRALGTGRAGLGGPRSCAPAGFRRLMAFEVGRARRLLESGLPLVDLVPPLARVAVAGFAGGGLAQLAAIEAVAYDVVSVPVKASKIAVGIETAKVLVGSRRRAGSRWRR